MQYILKQYLIGFGLIFICIKLHSQGSVFYIGHSLSDQIGEMVKSMTDQSGNGTLGLGYQSIPGAPLRWQWERKNAKDYNSLPPFLYGFYDTANGLTSGKYNRLILTESVPRQSQHEWGISETYRYVDSFYTFATRYNPDIKIYFYEVWHCTKSGTPTACAYDINSNPWRQRLSDDLPMWESVVTTINNKYKPRQPVCMIPVGQALGRLADEIKRGSVQGLTDVFQLFSDDIHLTDQGKYFVACVHYAVLYQKSPIGLPYQLKTIWGGNFKAPTAIQAKRMQEIAWESVTNYSNNCLASTTNLDDILTNSFKIFPNPSMGRIFVDYEGENKIIKLYNAQGRLIQLSTQKDIDISSLPIGLIIVEIEGVKQKLILNRL